MFIRLCIITLADLPMPIDVHDLPARAPGDVASAQSRRLGYQLRQLSLGFMIIPVDRLEFD